MVGRFCTEHRCMINVFRRWPQFSIHTHTRTHAHMHRRRGHPPVPSTAVRASVAEESWFRVSTAQGRRCRAIAGAAHAAGRAEAGRACRAGRARRGRARPRWPRRGRHVPKSVACPAPALPWVTGQSDRTLYELKISYGNLKLGKIFTDIQLPVKIPVRN